MCVPPYVLPPLNRPCLIIWTVQYIENQMVERFYGLFAHVLSWVLDQCPLGFINGGDFHSNS